LSKKFANALWKNSWYSRSFRVLSRQVKHLYIQMTPVQPQPIFLISANFQVAAADIIVATRKDESNTSRKE
jgi:hypothetical protein